MIESSKNTQKDPIERHLPKQDASDQQLLKLSLAALGVVFGDIGTSPLYALRECFHGEYGIAVSPANVLGVLSLMFWSLVMIVTFKYLIFVFMADNQGEGGVMVLTALIKSATGQMKNSRMPLVSIGLFAACLLYGDGMITPAISVLSAVEGIRIITPLFKPYVVPITIIILGGLFMIQRRGTALFLCHATQWMPLRFSAYHRTRLSKSAFSFNCESRLQAGESRGEERAENSLYQNWA
ncbi:MAG: KUP/HAK/KT family potassium transporter [Desulfobacterales bacterium]